MFSPRRDNKMGMARHHPADMEPEGGDGIVTIGRARGREAPDPHVAGLGSDLLRTTVLLSEDDGTTNTGRGGTMATMNRDEHEEEVVFNKDYLKELQGGGGDVVTTINSTSSSGGEKSEVGRGSRDGDLERGRA